MMQTLVHRGPDGDGHHIDLKRGLAFGHRRLSINDLAESGAQPLFSRDGKILLIVNGEFYDFKRRRAQPAATRFNDMVEPDVKHTSSVCAAPISRRTLSRVSSSCSSTIAPKR